MQMYLEHFGLDQAPFRITPNTALFFSGAKRGATLEALAFAILHEEGIVKVVGEVGAGKTMLCRMLLKQLPDTADTLYLANPTLGPDGLLRMIAEELGVDVLSDNAGALLLTIQQTLIDRFAQGRRVVALIDEAHAMPPAALEQVRLLSNLETGEHKLLQIVLFGQPELDLVLSRSGMRQLKDRITHHFRLDPLAAGEVGSYLDFRLRAAGYRGPELFSSRAVRLLARASEGLSRRINILADKALLSVFTEGRHQVMPAHVRAAIRDSEYPMPRRSGPWLAAGAVLLVAAGLAFHLRASLGALDWSSWIAPEERTAAPAAPPPVAAPPSAAPAATAPTDIAGVTAAAPPPGSTAGGPLPERAQERKAPAPRAVHAAPPAREPQPAAPTVPATAERGLAPEAQGRAEPSAPIGPIARAHQAGTPAWVRTTPPETWFLQLYTIDGGRIEDVENYLERLLTQLDPAQLRVYVRDLGWGLRVGIIYGEFASRADALTALRALPASLRESGAYLRQVQGLR